MFEHLVVLRAEKYPRTVPPHRNRSPPTDQRMSSKQVPMKRTKSSLLAIRLREVRTPLSPPSLYHSCAHDGAASHDLLLSMCHSQRCPLAPLRYSFLTRPTRTSPTCRCRTCPTRADRECLLLPSSSVHQLPMERQVWSGWTASSTASTLKKPACRSFRHRCGRSATRTSLGQLQVRFLSDAR
jgi:hypothetical protein